MRVVAGRLRAACACFIVAACSGGDEPSAPAGDPSRLSARGLYGDIARRAVVANAFEFTPDYPLWSDGADKRRWLILPEGEQVDTSDVAHWDFPIGTKLFKEFSLNGRLLETRLIERTKHTGRTKEDFFMGSFIWRRDQSDAVLTSDGKDNVNGTEHDVPAQKFCNVCHRGEPSAVLGFSAVQLSASGTLREVARRDLLSNDPSRTFPVPGNEVESSALGMLHANCGHCHAEAGVASFMHMRILPEETEHPVEELDLYRSLVGAPLSDEWEDQPERFTQRVVPGKPDESAIVYRMEQRGDDALVPDQMPPLATRKVDEPGVAALRAWIESLPREGQTNLDGGGPDHASDADAPDAVDAQLTDAEAPRAGERDAGERDAGERDAGERDAGERDAGERDAGEHGAGIDGGSTPTGPEMPGVTPGGSDDDAGIDEDPDEDASASFSVKPTPYLLA